MMNIEITEEEAKLIQLAIMGRIMQDTKIVESTGGPDRKEEMNQELDMLGPLFHRFSEGKTS